MCSVWGFINKPNKTKSNSAHPHLQHTRGALKGGTPGLVPGRDLFFTWLQLNYSRQLEPSLPLRTTLLAADLVPADDAVLDTHLTVPSEQPWPLNRSSFFFFFCPPASPAASNVFPSAVDYGAHWSCLEGLTFRRWHNLSCAGAENLWAWWCL